MGNDRALPDLIAAAGEEKLPYLTFIEIRNAIEELGGTMPEDLPTPEKSIQQIEKEQMERLQKKAKAGKLMLDE